MELWPKRQRPIPPPNYGDALTRSASAHPNAICTEQMTARVEGHVGIWHETYCIEANAYEAIYSGMPPHGLGRVGELVPITERTDRARQRLDVE